MTCLISDNDNNHNNNINNDYNNNEIIEKCNNSILSFTRLEG